MACFGCAAQTRREVATPAHVDWKTFRRVAVLQFHGSYGEIVRRNVYERLLQVNHFTSTDTVQFDALAQTPCNSAEGPLFVSDFSGLQVDVAIGGRVTSGLHDMPGTDQMEIQEGTGYYKKEKNLQGEWIDVEIKRTVVRPVPYVLRQGFLAVDYCLLNLRTGQPMAADTVTQDYNVKFGGKPTVAPPYHRTGDLPSPDTTMEELSTSLASKLVARLSRMKLVSTVGFDDRGNHRVAHGVTLARSGDWDAAISLWQDIIRCEPNNAPAYYNLGLAYEGLGDLEGLNKARTFYEKAARYGDNGPYADAVERVKRLILRSDSNW